MPIKRHPLYLFDEALYPTEGVLSGKKGILAYPRNEMSTPAATAEPITPEMLLDMQ